jgi:hypothetical protein
MLSVRRKIDLLFQMQSANRELHVITHGAEVASVGWAGPNGLCLNEQERRP